MSSTEFNIGLADETRSSSRVLRPPVSSQITIEKV